MNDKIYTNKQEFILKTAEKTYEHESERSKNMLNQSQRLLVIQTLLITALSYLYPIIQGLSNADKYKELSEFVIFFALTTLLLSLALNLISQWGFPNKSFPVPSVLEDNIDNYLKKNNLEYNSNTEYQATKQMWDEILRSIRKSNKKRASLLIASIVALFVSIVSFVIFGLPLIL